MFVLVRTSYSLSTSVIYETIDVFNDFTEALDQMKKSIIELGLIPEEVFEYNDSIDYLQNNPTVKDDFDFVIIENESAEVHCKYDYNWSIKYFPYILIPENDK